MALTYNELHLIKKGSFAINIKVFSNLSEQGEFAVFYYEVICICCRKKFRVYEGTLRYKQVKENMKGKYTCEECGHNIRLEAIKNFFNK
ncbi:hypothetical protein [Priestia megaterium]|uniref:hypothetical protein n=1 Tax=Priestia megaterium TaxID=1404 RepID=UPI003B9F251F